MQRPSSRVSTVGALAVLASAALSPAARTQADSARRRYTAADADFMTGMIVHHAQAVLIAGWAPAHGARPALPALCARLAVGPPHERPGIQRWLRERPEP